MKSHLPCPDCNSTDALTDYGDHSYCFSCGSRRSGEGEYTKVEVDKKKPPVIPRAYLTFETLKKRSILKEVCEVFGYGLTPESSTVGLTQCAPYYDPKDNTLVAQKLRYPDKSFRWLGSPKEAGLFGQHLYGSHGGERLVITEGEIDCLTIYQCVTKGTAVVSLKDGASGVERDLQNNIQFINKYKEIVLAFDNDKPGKEAVEKALRILPMGKVSIFRYPNETIKDANDILKELGVTAVTEGIYKSIAYRPDGIINADTLWENLKKPIVQGLSYPWPTLSDITYGIRENEMYIFGAGTGMGKTEFFKEIEAHLVVQHEATVGIIHLEESLEDTTIGLMNKYSSKLFHIPGSGFTEDEKFEAFKKTAGTGRVFIYDSFGATDYETIKENIRYMVSGCNCRFIFLDHLTALTDGLDEKANVNQAMKRIMSGLASLIREYKFTLFAISHLRKPEGKPHEEGGRVHLDDLYGSAAIKQWANFVFGLERNQQAEEELERHTTILRCLKDRYTGRSTGKLVKILYDQDTGRLIDTAGFTPAEGTPF